LSIYKFFTMQRLQNHTGATGGSRTLNQCSRSSQRLLERPSHALGASETLHLLQTAPTTPGASGSLREEELHFADAMRCSRTYLRTLGRPNTSSSPYQLLGPFTPISLTNTSAIVPRCLLNIFRDTRMKADTELVALAHAPSEAESASRNTISFGRRCFVWPRLRVKSAASVFAMSNSSARPLDALRCAVFKYAEDHGIVCLFVCLTFCLWV
jgi:hypothetical protein